MFFSAPDQRLSEDETSDSAVNIDRKNFINNNENQAINMGYYKLLVRKNFLNKLQLRYKLGLLIYIYIFQKSIEDKSK